MLSIRIHHGGNFQRCPGRMYSECHVDIFDMVNINLFTVVALKMMIVQLGYSGKSEPLFNYYLRPLTSLDEGLYALACGDDVRSLTTLDRSFKLIEVIEDVMGQLSSEETKLDGEVGFSDVAGSGIENFGLSHDESFGVDDLNLNLNEHVGLNRLTQEPIVAEVRTHEPSVEEGIDQEDESAPSDEQFFNDVEGIYIAYETKYEGQSSEDAGKDDDDDEDDYFLICSPTSRKCRRPPQNETCVAFMLPGKEHDCMICSPTSESAGGLPKTIIVSHSLPPCSCTSAMEFSFPIAFVLPGEHECNESFKLGRPPALSSSVAMKVSNWGGHLHFREVGEFAPQLHESAGGLPKTKLVSHSCSLAGSTSAMKVSIPIAFVLPGREHECNESFKLGRPPALSFSPVGSHIWFKLYGPPSDPDVDLIGTICYLVMLANTSMEYNPLYDADKGFNVMPSSFHDVGDVEFQDNWGRVWQSMDAAKIAKRRCLREGCNCSCLSNFREGSRMISGVKAQLKIKTCDRRRRGGAMQPDGRGGRPSV
ncbi:transposase, MuDR, MULE transposase domain protein [Tanacetum coccineum]|uniref:Transposase, MuDR, MULE transposase domain protein n=1 Tax=Tanacetum coccineum TaxID=301880 RepID=A0ABQ4XX88_9ASTR